MYINLQETDNQQSTRNLETNRFKVQQRLTEANRALTNLRLQPANSYRLEQRLAEAERNLTFWQEMHRRLEQQLAADDGNTTQLVVT